MTLKKILIWGAVGITVFAVTGLLYIEVEQSQTGHDIGEGYSNPQIQTWQEVPGLRQYSPPREVITITEPRSSGMILSTQPTIDAPLVIQSESDPARKIIQTADFTLESDAPTVVRLRLDSLVQESGGFIARSTALNHDTRHESINVTYRIPSAHFESIIGEIRTGGFHILRETVTGNDITEEYYDAEGRLKNKLRVEKRILDHLSSAKSVGEVLEVEKALAEARGEIDRLEGWKKFHDDRISLSTISVIINMTSDRNVVTVDQSPIVATLARSYQKGVAGLIATTGAIFSFLIAGAPIYVPAIGMILLYRRLVKKRAATQSKSTA